MASAGAGDARRVTRAAGHASGSGDAADGQQGGRVGADGEEGDDAEVHEPVSPHWTLRPRVSSARTPTSVAMAMR